MNTGQSRYELLLDSIVNNNTNSSNINNIKLPYISNTNINCVIHNDSILCLSCSKCFRTKILYNSHSCMSDN